jgi:WD40 repeat protein
VLLYPSTNPRSGPTTTLVLPGAAAGGAGADAIFTALAVSRDGKRVVAFGGAPGYGVTVFDASTGAAQASSEAVSCPGPVTVAALCPGNADRLVAAGPQGIFFYRLFKSHQSTELELVRGEVPSGPGLAGSPGASSSSSSSPAAPEPLAVSTRAILDFVADTVASDPTGATLSAPTGETAAREVAGRHGANVWLSVSWAGEGCLLAANAAGDLVVYVPATGAIARRVSVASLPGAPPGVIATSVACTSTHALVGCSDGVVRYLALPASPSADPEGKAAAGSAAGPAVPAYSLTSAVFLSATPATYPGAPESFAAPHMGAEGADLAVVSITLTPSCAKAFAGTRGGTLHALPMPPPALPGSRSSVSHAPVTAAALLEHPPSRTTIAAASLPTLAVTSAAGLTSLGPAPGGGPYTLTAGSDGIVRLWAPAAAGSADSSPAGAVAPRLVAKVALGTFTGGRAAAPAPAPAAAPAPEGDSTTESKEGKDDGASPRPATSPSSSSSSSSYDPAHFSPARVTSVAVHPRLPLVAVGCADGRVSLLLASRGDATGVTLTPVSADACHTGPISALLFSDAPAADRALLVSISASSALLVVHDVKAALSAGMASRTGAGAAAAPLASAVAFAQLPSLADNSDAAVTAACWADQTLVLGCASGHVLTIAVPSSLPAAPCATALGLADLNAALTLRGRLTSGVTGLVATTAAGPAAPAMLFAALAGEKSLAVVPLDAKHMPSEGSVASLSPSAFAAVPPSTPVLFSLSAHKRAGHTLAISPAASSTSSAIIASGGADGAVTMLAVSVSPEAHGSAEPFRIAVSGSAFSPLHAGTITALRFSADGRALLATSALDGTVVACAISGVAADRAEAAAAAAPGGKKGGNAASPSETALVVTDAASAAARPSSVAAAVGPASALAPAGGLVASLTRDREEAAVREHAAVHGALLADVDGFRARLRTILAANASAPSIERLERREFVVDQAGHDAIVREYDAKAADRRAAYAAESASLDADVARVRTLCVDTAEALACEVRALQADASVRNFPIRKRTAEEQALADRTALLRSVEVSAAVGEEGVDGARGGAWAPLASRVPADADWIYHAGLLAPSADPAKQHEAILASKDPSAVAAAAAAKKKAADAESSGGSGGGGGAEKKDAGAADAAGAAAAGAAAAGAAEGAGGGGGGGEKGAGEKGEEAAAPKDLVWEGEAVLSLLFHPAAVRTPAQKRVQATLLGELLRATQRRFNVSFDKLRGEKLELIDSIRQRHARLRDILTELGTAVVHMTEADSRAADMTAATAGNPAAVVTYASGIPAGSSAPSRRRSVMAGGVAAAANAGVDGVASGRTPIGPVPGPNGTTSITDPFLAPTEDPAAVLKVTDAEVGMSPYISPAEQKRRADEADARRRAAAANKDDAPERALQEMMGGTLEGKDELALLAESLIREPWMDEVPEADYSPEQKATMAAYKQRLALFEDEKAKARNALNTEMNKLLGELKDATEAFDAKVQAMSKARVTTASVIAAQELYISRLLLTAQSRSRAAERDTALEARFQSLLPLESVAVEAHEAFKTYVESHAARVEEAAARDKALDGAFKAALREAVPGLENDMVKILHGLFRRRDTEAVAAAAAAGTAAIAAAVAAASAAAAPAAPAAASSPPPMARQASTRMGMTGGRKGGAAAGGAGGHDVPADPFASAPVEAARAAAEEAKAAAVRAAALAPLEKGDCPEGFGDLPDQPAWPVLNSLRRDKVASEQALADEVKVRRGGKCGERAREVACAPSCEFPLPLPLTPPYSLPPPPSPIIAVPRVHEGPPRPPRVAVRGEQEVHRRHRRRARRPRHRARAVSERRRGPAKDADGAGRGLIQQARRDAAPGRRVRSLRLERHNAAPRRGRRGRQRRHPQARAGASSVWARSSHVPLSSFPLPPPPPPSLPLTPFPPFLPSFPRRSRWTTSTTSRGSARASPTRSGRPRTGTRAPLTRGSFSATSNSCAPSARSRTSSSASTSHPRRARRSTRPRPSSRTSVARTCGRWRRSRRRGSALRGRSGRGPRRSGRSRSRQSSSTRGRRSARPSCAPARAGAGPRPAAAQARAACRPLRLRRQSRRRGRRRRSQTG